MATFEIFNSICLPQKNLKLAIFNYFENNAMEIIITFPRAEKNEECTLCLHSSDKCASCGSEWNSGFPPGSSQTSPFIKMWSLPSY